MMDAHTASRKDDHLRINLENQVKSSLTNGFEAYRFLHQALPEIDLDEIDISLTLFNKRFTRSALDLLDDWRHAKSSPFQPTFCSGCTGIWISNGRRFTARRARRPIP